MMVLDFMVL